MAILQGDIRLVAAQVMTDAANGGGAPTSTLIVDGQSNGVFPDVSEVDRAGGRVNLRKVVVQVNTNNTDTYLGANVILESAPADLLVSVTLFSTGQTFDRRTNATDRIESYLAVGPSIAPVLFGDHIEGQMTLSLLGQLNSLVPVPGTTLVVRKYPGTPNVVEQYVRVTTVASHERTFTDQAGDFTRLEITLAISDPLSADFPGFEATRYDTDLNFSARARVFDTVVADAARYYGVSPLTAGASLGDYTVSAESIFTNLVPSAQAETPIADARMNQQVALPVAAGAPLTQSITLAFSPTQALYVGGGITPGSLTLSRAGITLKDKGGRLVNDATSAQVGMVDYGNGVLSLTADVFGSGGGTQSVTYTPGASPTLVTQSLAIPVTQEGQRLTYVVTLLPIPVRGSTQVSFRAQGRWYTLADDGSGAVRGSDSSFGVGTINYSTGTLSMTLGALPDIGGKVICAWAGANAAPAQSTVPQKNSNAVFGRLFMGVDVGSAIVPGSLTVSWSYAGSHTAADDGAGGFTGGGTGEVEYATGIVRFSPTELPSAATVMMLNYTGAEVGDVAIAALTDAGATWSFSLGGPVTPHTVELAVVGTAARRIYISTDQDIARFVQVFDDGDGGLQIDTPNGYVGVGAVNYSTGFCTVAKLVADFNELQNSWVENSYASSAGGSIVSGGAAAGNITQVAYAGQQIRSVPLVLSGSVGSLQPEAAPWAWWGAFAGGLQARFAGAAGAAVTLSVTLTQLYAQSVLGVFFVGADKFVVSEPSAGIYRIERNPSPASGVGTVAGACYAAYSAVAGSGTFTAPGWTAQMVGYSVLTSWPAGAPSAMTVSAAVANPALGGSAGNTYVLVDTVVLRTAVAPIRSGSFSMAGTFGDGTPFTATADSSGIISSGSAPSNNTLNAVGSKGSLGVFGRVDIQTGIGELRFGRRVADIYLDSLSHGISSWAYLTLPGVTLGESQGVQADTLRYNGSGYTYIPLDASIIGINPVRLPSDGRVPIFRSGSYAVVGHTAEITAAVANGQTINCARVRLSRVRVVGSDGVVVNTGYTADLDAGLVTFDDVLGYAQPVTVQHRIEDMALVSDAQINGQLTFTRPLTHDYPLGSNVSSALVAGDLAASVSVLFDQVTWTGEWSDTVIGGAATGTFNDIANPVAVTNAGALTERWCLQFTNTTTFTIAGEHVGVIGTGNTGEDCAPANPSTGEPYFVVPAAGWGLGWSAGNVLRFDTVGAEFPVWVVRTIQQGPETIDADQFTILVRGDVDRP